MAVNLATLGYRLGSPGMVASHSYKHNRQHINDAFWVNTHATKKLYFGTAALRKANKLESPEGTAGFAGEFIGVYQDNEKYAGINYYAPKDNVTVFSMGDIWVLVPTGITINTLDNVCYLETNTTVNGVAIPGVFTNAAAAAGIIAVPNAKFLTPNCGGIAVIGFDTWKGN